MSVIGLILQCPMSDTFANKDKKMKKYTESCLEQLAIQEKKFTSLYKEAAALFNIPDCSMWILYYLIISDEDITQQDLIKKMLFPKQTINSAVNSLEKKELLKLEVIPNTKNKKKLLLTNKGLKLAKNTVLNMRNAECRTVENMGKEKMLKFMELYGEFYSELQKEFKKEGIINAK